MWLCVYGPAGHGVAPAVQMQSFVPKLPPGAGAQTSPFGQPAFGKVPLCEQTRPSSPHAGGVTFDVELGVQLPPVGPTLPTAICAPPPHATSLDEKSAHTLATMLNGVAHVAPVHVLFA